MNDFIQLITNYFKGEPIYAIGRRILNLIFNISIASFLYETIYGKYYWISLSNHGAVMDFFLRGKFILPSIIFCVVVVCTSIIGQLVLIGFTHFQNIKLTTKLANLNIEHYEIKSGLKIISKLSKFSGPMILSKDVITELYFAYKHLITEDALQSFDNMCMNERRNVSDSIIVFVNAIAALIVYSSILPELSLWFTIIIIVILLMVIYIFSKAYLLLDNLPLLARKLLAATEKYIISETK